MENVKSKMKDINGMGLTGQTEMKRGSVRWREGDRNDPEHNVEKQDLIKDSWRRNYSK